MATIHEILYENGDLRDWDQFSYEVYGPMSLDDEAKITIVLYNKDYTNTREIILRCI